MKYNKIKVNCPRCGEPTKMPSSTELSTQCTSCGYRWTPFWDNEKKNLNYDKFPFKTFWINDY